MNEIDDNTVQQACKGDKQAFRLIVLHYVQAVNRLAYRYTADASYAEDIAQETFNLVCMLIQTTLIYIKIT